MKGSFVRLGIVFAIALSLISVPGALYQFEGFPTLNVAHAVIAPNQPWLPAGPTMDTLTHPVFTDSASEFSALVAPNSPIDFTDWPLSPNLVDPLTTNPNFQVTAPISETGYFELQFHMANNYWGCQFNFGAASCGVNIRQAFAHGLDKIQFVGTERVSLGFPIDNPVPPSVALNTPDPCGWDSLFPQTGSGCIVNGAGGTAYHLAAATFGTGCSNMPSFPYTPGCGTPDFCAAADHLIAAGVATGKNPSNAAVNPCVVTGIVSSVITNPVHLFVRNDDIPRLHAGDSYAEFICALFTGSFSVGCGVSPSTTNIVQVDHGPITAFPGFFTSGTTVALTWWVYTGGYSNILTFDASLFFIYNSRFVSGIPSIVSPMGPCSSRAVPSFAPANYMYLCDSTFDSNGFQAEYAPCLTAPGDPATGQTNHPGTPPTVTFANCPTTTNSTAASASYHAQDNFGSKAYSIPLFSGKNQFAYLNGWTGATLHKGDGFTPPGNFFLTLDAWNPTPPTANAIRQGYAQSSRSVNPFIGDSVWDEGITGSVYDTLLRTNPDSPQSSLNWMTVATTQLPRNTLSYVPPPGTVSALRFTLRNDILWQTGQKVTAWDEAFAVIASRSSGVNGGLDSVTGVKVLSPTQIDLDLSGIGPFTQLYASGAALPFTDHLAPIPGRDWVNPSVCSAQTWDNFAGNQNFAAANAGLTGCIAASSAVTASGVILPNPGSSQIDPNKLGVGYDPVMAGNLIGDGPWMCKANGLIGGPGCSSTHASQIGPGGEWTLTRYGMGTPPGGTLNTYFRSSGNLALWAWSQDRGVFSSDFLNFGAVALCFGKAVGTAGCTVWQHGIAGSPAGTPVGVSQVSIVARFVGVNWVSPYDWINSPPQNIIAFPPVLHEGSVTLNPCTIDPVNGYDC